MQYCGFFQRAAGELPNTGQPHENNNKSTLNAGYAGAISAGLCRKRQF